jgi:hypothetical protein
VPNHEKERVTEAAGDEEKERASINRKRASVSDEGMTPRVLMFSIPAFGYRRSLLEGYVKPARPNMPTWSRSQETPCKP